MHHRSSSECGGRKNPYQDAPQREVVIINTDEFDPEKHVIVGDTWKELSCGHMARSLWRRRCPVCDKGVDIIRQIKRCVRCGKLFETEFKDRSVCCEEHRIVNERPQNAVRKERYASIGKQAIHPSLTVREVARRIGVSRETVRLDENSGLNKIVRRFKIEFPEVVQFFIDEYGTFDASTASKLVTYTDTLDRGRVFEFIYTPALAEDLRILFIKNAPDLVKWFLVEYGEFTKRHAERVFLYFAEGHDLKEDDEK